MWNTDDTNYHSTSIDTKIPKEHLHKAMEKSIRGLIYEKYKTKEKLAGFRILRRREESEFLVKVSMKSGNVLKVVIYLCNPHVTCRPRIETYLDSNDPICDRWTGKSLNNEEYEDDDNDDDYNDD
jgi:hypothetical protein